MTLTRQHQAWQRLLFWEPASLLTSTSGPTSIALCQIKQINGQRNWRTLSIQESYTLDRRPRSFANSTSQYNSLTEDSGELFFGRSSGAYMLLWPVTNCPSERSESFDCGSTLSERLPSNGSLCVSSCHQHPPWVRCAPLHLSATKTWSCHGQTPHPQQCYCRQYSATKGSFNSPEWWHRQGSLMHSYSATTT